MLIILSELRLGPIYSRIMNSSEKKVRTGGAEFGQISIRLARLYPGVKQIFAIDANPDHSEILELNLATAGINFQVYNKAISDFHGNAELIFPHG